MSQSEYSDRRQRVACELSRACLDALLVSSPANIRYLSGFTGSAGMLLLEPDSSVLITDPRYTFQAVEQTGCAVRTARRSIVAEVARCLARRGIKRLGFEPAHLNFEQYSHLRDKCAHLLPFPGLVERARMVKTQSEIELIRRASAITSEVFSALLPLIRPGVSELDLAAEIEYRMRKLGAEGPAFPPIVTSGLNSALPHASPSSKMLSSNELVLIDMGARLAGYSSDMTRTVWVGEQPEPRILRLYNAVAGAQQAAIDAVRQGVTAASVDRAARSRLRAAGLEQAFLHASGHGLGLEIHDPPRLGRPDRTKLKPGMAVTIEPGVYFKELGGIRIEDTVIVTSEGAEILTTAKKDFLIL